MLISNTLRIERGDDFPIIDYRIREGCVESRILDSPRVDRESGWQRITAAQLSSHVRFNTVVAQWLHRRMGLHALLRACNQHPAFADDAAHHCTEQIAA